MPSPSESELEREHRRQQALVQALFAPPAASAPPADWLRDAGAASTLRGWQAYRAHAGMLAERVLASACPTVQQLVGEDSFALIARACWQRHPPSQGDVERWALNLPRFLAEDEQLVDVPYLADCARLDLALAAAEQAADVQAEPQSLQSLAEHPPEALRLRLAPGVWLLASRWPVVALWQAHHGEDREAARLRAAQALQCGQGEIALVWRQGWKGRVCAIDAAEQRWLQACLRGASLAQALDEAGDAFGFEPWLLRTLPEGLLLGADLLRGM